MTELNLIKIGDLPARGTLANTDKFLVERADGENRSLTFEALVEGVNVNVGVGEVNTGSNLGTGARVFESKNGADLRFRTLIPAASNKIIVNENASTISLNVDEAQFSVTANLATHEARTNNPHNVTAAQVGNTTAQWNANQIQGRAISTTAPTSGQALVWNGTTWVPGNVSGAVTSVNGQTGAVTLNTGAIAEGTNLYYTDARVDARITAANLVSNASLSSHTGNTSNPHNTTAAQVGAYSTAQVDALDAQNVKLSGNQTVGGTKTFSTIPVLPASDPTTANQATRKSYVDTLDAQNVKLTGAQTVSGAKTFSGIQTFTNDIRIDSDSTRSITFRTAAGVDIFSIERDVTNSRINFFAESTIPAVFTGLAPQSLVAPTNAADLTTKSYVDGLDAANVKLTGTQSIGGAKTFTTIPVLPATDPTTANQAARKGYVDGLDAANLKLTGDQSIAGVKTFSSIPVLPATSPTLADQATRKGYVDGLDAANVKLSGDQTVAGVKTFSSIPLTTEAQPATANSLARRDFVTGLDAANVKTTGNQTIAGVKTFSSNPISSAAQSTAVNALTRKDYVDGHINRTDNPHGVTAAQVGNTTAQWNANQLQGRAISTATPSDTQALAWDSSSNSWAPRTVSALLNQFLNIAEEVTGTTRTVVAADNNKIFRVNNGIIQLPDATANSGMVIGVYRLNNSVSIRPFTGQRVDNSLGEYLLFTNTQSVVLRANGGTANWEIVSFYTPLLNGTIPIEKGGTGGTTAAEARTNLGLDLIPISRGGTGATSVETAQANLRVPFRTTENVTSNTSIAAVDDGKILTVNSGSAHVALNLPSSANVSNGFTITIVKTQTPNEVRINRSGTDLIGGLTQFVLTGRYASVTLLLRDNVWYVQSFFNGAAITP